MKDAMERRRVVMKASARVLPLIAALVLFGACGGGDDDDAGEPAPAAQDRQQANHQECFAKYEVPAEISACIRGDAPPEQEDTDDDGLPDDSDPDPYSPANTEEPAEPETAQKTVSIGQGARDEGLGFKVLSLEQVESIPAADEFSESIYPPPGGKLYQAVVQVKNLGDVPADPFCGSGSAVLLDINDRNYEYEDPLGASGNDWICDRGIAPGFNAQATLGFKVPRSFRLGGLILWDGDSTDFDGSESNVAVVP
jgi:hypothetical protein